MSNLTTVINTLNSAETLEMCLNSVKDLGEIVLVDMHSDDTTVEIAKKFTDKIYYHERIGYVEPARNFALSKAATPWILVLDSDEEVSPSLAQVIKEITTKDPKEIEFTHYYIPRKTLIFGQWMEYSGWWPDDKVRLFKNGSVKWRDKIHSELDTTGEGKHFPAEEKYAIIHYHYTSISQWIERMNRYTTIQAREKVEEKYEFDWKDIIRKPLSEFLRRFFVWEGWRDGVVGLGICLMQALSEAIVYMKVREIQMKDKKIPDGKDENFIREVGEEFDTAEEEVGYYLEKLGLQSQLKRWLQKVLP